MAENGHSQEDVASLHLMLVTLCDRLRDRYV